MCKYLFIPVILETHDIREHKAVTNLDHFVKLRLLIFLYLTPCIFLILVFLGPMIVVGIDMSPKCFFDLLCKPRALTIPQAKVRSVY